MGAIHWFTLSDYGICALLGFILRYLQDKNKDPRPFWLFQLAASGSVSYVACFSYTFYGIKFVPIELWIIGLSFMGAFIVSSLDYMAKNSIITYMRKIASEILAVTDKFKKS